MRKLLRFGVVGCIATTSAMVSAQTNDVCSIALTSKAFNTVESSISDDIAYARRDELCSSTYDSVTTAQNKAKSAGFNLSYETLKIGGDKASRNASGRYEIHQTDFCRASAEDFRRAYASDYRSQIADVALEAWRDCVETQATPMMLEYAVAPSGQTFNGTLRRTPKTGQLPAKVTGITASGRGGDDVICYVGGNKVRANRPVQIAITVTQTTVSCSKDADESLDIGIQTDADSLPFVHLPSKVELAHDRFKEMDERIAALDRLVGQNTPVNSVFAFNQATCPTGFRPFVMAEGRVLVGTGNNGGQNKDEAGHALQGRDSGAIGGFASQTLNVQSLSRQARNGFWHTHGRGEYVVSLIEGGGETRAGTPISMMPPFVAVTYCVKS